jgi:subtilisin family serine protease
MNGPVSGAFGGQPERAEALRSHASPYTGRYVVLLDNAEAPQGLQGLRSAAGVRTVERVSGADPDESAAVLARADTSVLFDNLGVAVVETDPDQRHALVTAAEANPAVIAAEPERHVYALMITEAERTVTHTFPAYRSDDDQIARQARAEVTAHRGPAWDQMNCTWGLQAVRANFSTLTGRDVKVCVLDTGVDTDHPDLTGCLEETASFVEGESVEDANGHGTHCIGTVAGPADPASAPRYGVAGDARVLAGKVLSNRGSGTDGQILAGMSWAVSQGAKVISMSLGADVEPGELFPQTYERVAARALRLGTVMVAAAGNESDRPGVVRPVGRPANCPSVLAVAALNKDLATAFFSCGAINGEGGEVNIAAPGVDVFSAAPDGSYQSLMGTSMATPHVAGALALYAEADPEASAEALRDRLLSSAYPLPQPAEDVGTGLLQVP